MCIQPYEKTVFAANADIQQVSNISNTGLFSARFINVEAQFNTNVVLGSRPLFSLLF